MMGGYEWIYMAQDMDQRLGVLNTVINLGTVAERLTDCTDSVTFS
jgi:hypothetical protein